MKEQELNNGELVPFNAKENLRIASLPEILEIGYKNDRNTIKVLQSAFEKGWLTTGTEISYKRNSTLVNIVHHQGEDTIFKRIDLVITEGAEDEEEIPIKKALKNHSLLVYFKALSNKIEASEKNIQEYLLTSLGNLSQGMKTDYHAKVPITFIYDIVQRNEIEKTNIKLGQYPVDSFLICTDRSKGKNAYHLNR